MGKDAIIKLNTLGVGSDADQARDEIDEAALINQCTVEIQTVLEKYNMIIEVENNLKITPVVTQNA